MFIFTILCVIHSLSRLFAFWKATLYFCFRWCPQICVFLYVCVRKSELCFLVLLFFHPYRQYRAIQNEIQNMKTRHTLMFLGVGGLCLDRSVCLCVSVCAYVCVFVRVNTECVAFLVSSRQTDPRWSEQREISDICHSTEREKKKKKKKKRGGGIERRRGKRDRKERKIETQKKEEKKDTKCLKLTNLYVFDQDKHLDSRKAARTPPVPWFNISFSYVFGYKTLKNNKLSQRCAAAKLIIRLFCDFVYTFGQ